MEITLHIPDELARLLGGTGEIERRALEALALEEYKLGHLTKPELRRLLGYGIRYALDASWRPLAVSNRIALAELKGDGQDWQSSASERMRLRGGGCRPVNYLVV